MTPEEVLQNCTTIVEGFEGEALQAVQEFESPPTTAQADARSVLRAKLLKLWEDLAPPS